MQNLCIQCGKKRIDGKTWEEKVGASVVVYTKTICPDSDCQAIVDAGILARQKKNAEVAQKKAEAKLAREKLLATVA